MAYRSPNLRELLQREKIIVAPGAYDALSAKLIEAAGFPAVYITGAGLASSRLGVPDIGLMTMTEVLESARSIVNATKIPVICDTDTGYGNAINLMRTVREFEQVGVDGIQIEDQIMAKRCGHIKNKHLISKKEMTKKIEAAQYAKNSNDFLLLARTDAIAVEGFDSAIDRAKDYLNAGADVIFVEAPENIDQLKRIPEILKDGITMVNVLEGGGKTPVLPVSELEALGFKLAIYPTTVWISVIHSAKRVLSELKDKGTTRGLSETMVSFEEMFEVVRLSEYQELEKRFLTLE
jgi:carboxyvinyl-carboxyphosphonate phosphorylmutase